MWNMQPAEMRDDSSACYDELLVVHIQKLRWLGLDNEVERLIGDLRRDDRCAALACVPDTD